MKGEREKREIGEQGRMGWERNKEWQNANEKSCTLNMNVVHTEIFMLFMLIHRRALVNASSCVMAEVSNIFLGTERDGGQIAGGAGN